MQKALKKAIAAVVACALTVLPLFACSDTPSHGEVKLVAVTEVFDWHTDLQKSYLSASDYKAVPEEARGSIELGRPRPLRLEWEYDGDCSGYTVELTHTDNFSDGVSYRTDNNYIDVYNLYSDSLYTWRVIADVDGVKVVSEKSGFATAGGAPRNLYVDGITNARDIGGWQTDGGGRVKQGMIYRTGRLNKSKQPDVEIEITPRGIETMKGELGIKTEIDFRTSDPDVNNTENGGITESPLGAGVAYYNVPMAYEISNTLLENKAAVVRTFELLGDANNYPLMFHCDIGTDRTGLYAFLINGLLGVSEDDLYRDYLFSNFGTIGGRRTIDNIKNRFVKTIKDSAGDTLAQKIRNCLINTVGVDASDIDALCEIMSND